MGWFSRRKEPSPAPAADESVRGPAPTVVYDSRVARDLMLAEFDRARPHGDLDPDEARKLADRLEPLVEADMAKHPWDPTWDHSVYTAHSTAKHRAGRVRGQHFTQWPDTIRQMKRDGHREEALKLLIECIDAAERDHSGRAPAPWYTEQAAIVFRQMGRLDAEVAILERWVSACPKQFRSSTNKIEERLAKAQALRDKRTR